MDMSSGETISGDTIQSSIFTDEKSIVMSDIAQILEDNPDINIEYNIGMTLEELRNKLHNLKYDIYQRKLNDNIPRVKDMLNSLVDIVPEYSSMNGIFSGDSLISMLMMIKLILGEPPYNTYDSNALLEAIDNFITIHG